LQSIVNKETVISYFISKTWILPWVVPMRINPSPLMMATVVGSYD